MTTEAKHHKNMEVNKNEEIFQVLANLESEDRHLRRQALKCVEVRYLGPAASSKTDAVFSILEQPLLKVFADSVEKNRELAVGIYSNLLESEEVIHDLLTYLIPTLESRLTQMPTGVCHEPSEELRLSLLHLLCKVIDISQQEMNKYMTEVINIITSMLQDEYAEVIKLSCSCAMKLAKATASTFHLQSESVIKPLILKVTNHHSKVRSAVIYCIGEIIQYGNNSSVNDVVPHFAQRLFDDSCSVRLAVVTVTGTWLMTLTDRYSYFHLLMPLLLTGVKDEYPDVKKAAVQLWLDVGLQYLEENKEQLKDNIEFSNPVPHYYPKGVERPNLGCRILVQRNVSKILPALVNDIGDWAESTRTMASSLLYTLILNCEQNITQHIELCITILVKASLDPAKEVSKNVDECCALIGQFVSAELYSKILLDRLVSVAGNVSVMRILSAVVSCSPTLTADNMKQITGVLCQQDVCCVHNTRYQCELVACIKALVGQHGDMCQPFSYDLFTIILCTLAITGSGELKEACLGVVNDLSSAYYHHKSPSHLASTHLDRVVHTYCTPTYQHWTAHSDELHILTTLLSITGSDAGKHLDVILPMLKENVKREKDCELRLDVYRTLAELIIAVGREKEAAECLDEQVCGIISDIILPGCKWRAGKSETAVRTMAASALWAISSQQHINVTKLLELLEDVIKCVVQLIEDDSRETRLVTCKLIRHLIKHTGERWPIDCYHSVYMPLMKRIDDRHDDIRQAAIHCLLQYGTALTGDTYHYRGDYDITLYREHVRAIYQGLLLYLDDSDRTVQQNVLGVLKVFAKLAPDMLRDETRQVRDRHREHKYCDQLCQHLHNLTL